MRVRYVNILAEIDIQKAMKTPRRIGERDSWYKAARKAIPEIPELGFPPEMWYIVNYTATLDKVIFHLDTGSAATQLFATVIIDRKASSLG